MTNSRKLKCTCNSKFQDKKYGNKKRVHNALQGKVKGFRCTVCGNRKLT